MKAAVLREYGKPLRFEAVEVGAIAANEVLVRTVACGVCHSDRLAQAGHSPRARSLPVILGHEAAGIVEAVGDAVTELRVGDRVLTCAAAACGSCKWCQRGHQQHCVCMARERASGMPPRLTIGGDPVHAFVGLGGFATHQLVNERAVAKLPDAMPLDRAALLGCAVLTGFGAVKHAACVRAGDRVVVIGCGGVGLSVIQAARLFGAEQIVAVDVQAGALGRARAFGATHLVDSSREPAAERVLAITGGADHVLEAVGRPATVNMACEMAGTRGVITVIGLPRPGERIEIAAEHFFAEKRLQGSKMGRQWPAPDVAELCRLYLSGRLLLDEMVSRSLPLDEVNTALDELETVDMARTVITF